MNTHMWKSLLVVLILAPLCGLSQEVETNYWRQIPFLSSTSSVSHLSQELNDLSLPPLPRFHALCAMFINNVHINESLTNITNSVGSSFDWVDQAEVEPNLMNKKGRPIHYTLTFTNALADWGRSPSVIEDGDKPRLFIGLVRAPSINNRTREMGIRFLKGDTAYRVSHYWFSTDWEDKWVVFSRNERGDYLRVYAATGGRICGEFRKTPAVDVQQPDAEVQSEGVPSD